jgi:hypothetical protein
MIYLTLWPSECVARPLHFLSSCAAIVLLGLAVFTMPSLSRLAFSQKKFNIFMSKKLFFSLFLHYGPTGVCRSSYLALSAVARAGL